MYIIFAVLLPLLGIVSAPALPKCKEGTAQPSALRKGLGDEVGPFEEEDAAAMAASRAARSQLNNPKRTLSVLWHPRLCETFYS
ncbi:MAG: hypothetical protein AVDCRST_MAG86-4020 [uncultured Truepera sp.]|uniref:Uncharacterized protein n=1 Tax=uncultured Truepera sp. TaxID=543023 RepID=A0A6J4VSQ9_9DEIN|nr:MAG: hypothetical protein AVDCRST_MAG86-4020 [uncultured Truepera sp.]